jgi:hypothetical protein
MSEEIKFKYKNWKGEVSIRTMIPIEVKFCSTEWHTEEQWIMFAHDVSKGEIRGFALRDCDFSWAGRGM